MHFLFLLYREFSIFCVWLGCNLGSQAEELEDQNFQRWSHQGKQPESSRPNRKMGCKRGAEQDDPSKVTQKKDEEMKNEILPKKQSNSSPGTSRKKTGPSCAENFGEPTKFPVVMPLIFPFALAP